MKTRYLTFLRIILIIFFLTTLPGSVKSQSGEIYREYERSYDTLQKLQHLYNGALWTNRFSRFEGDQFFLTPYFITGSITFNHKTFNNIRLKYDIYSDELITPINYDEIIQLNREMVDSFTLIFKNKPYRFISFQNDSSGGLSGYYRLLYRGNSLMYARYQKSLSSEITTKSDGEFIQQIRIYLVISNEIFTIKTRKDFFRVLGSRKRELKNFIAINRLKVSVNEPESLIRVLEYYDKISK